MLYHSWCWVDLTTLWWLKIQMFNLSIFPLVFFLHFLGTFVYPWYSIHFFYHVSVVFFSYQFLSCRLLQDSKQLGGIFQSTSSCCCWPVSVSRWRAHSRSVVLQTLHRGQRGTRLCPYLFYFDTLYLFLLSHIRGSFVLIPPVYSPSPSSSTSAAAAVVSLSPASSSPSCSHHRIPTHVPRFLSAALHRSRIGRVAI